MNKAIDTIIHNDEIFKNIKYNTNKKQLKFTRNHLEKYNNLMDFLMKNKWAHRSLNEIITQLNVYRCSKRKYILHLILYNFSKNDDLYTKLILYICNS